MDQSYEYLKKEINKYETVIAGISGGPDSMALLDLLLNLKKEKEIKIICAHVNHNSGRKGQYTDQEFVKEFCKKNNIIFELLVIKEYRENNFHNEAHKIRYKFFEDLIKKYNAKFLLTAHHGDDLIETILMRIVRGSNLKGYAGFDAKIMKENYTILRPLIFTTKDEILNYNNIKKIKYVIDDSNQKDIYTRNRYRKYIIPKLKDEDNNVHQKFYKFHETLKELNEYIEHEVDNIFDILYKNNNLDIEKFNILDNIIKKRIIEKILILLYDNNINLISDKHIDLVIKLTEKNNNSKLILPNNILVIKEYNNLIFTINKQIDNYKIKIEVGTYSLKNNRKIEVLMKNNLDTDNFICRLSKEEVKFPLYIRNRKNGDKMFVKNLNGSKKIKEIFIENKISKLERENWPIVVDSNDTIVWLPGLKKSKYDKQITEKYDIILKYY